MPFCVITTRCNNSALELEAILQLVAGHDAWAWQVQPGQAGVQMGFSKAILLLKPLHPTDLLGKIQKVLLKKRTTR
jgi:hypothetical protein